MMFAHLGNDAALRAMMLPSAMMCPAGHRGKHHIMPQRSEGTSFCKAIHHFAVRRYIMKKPFCEPILPLFIPPAVQYLLYTSTLPEPLERKQVDKCGRVRYNR